MVFIGVVVSAGVILAYEIGRTSRLIELLAELIGLQRQAEQKRSQSDENFSKQVAHFRGSTGEMYRQMFAAQKAEVEKLKRKFDVQPAPPELYERFDRIELDVARRVGIFPSPQQESGRERPCSQQEAGKKNFNDTEDSND